MIWNSSVFVYFVYFCTALTTYLYTHEWEGDMTAFVWKTLLFITAVDS